MKYATFLYWNSKEWTEIGQAAWYNDITFCKVIHDDILMTPESKV